jgi:transposase
VISRVGTVSAKEVPTLLRGKDVQEIQELKRQGLSINAISKLTGNDRKTIRKYLAEPEDAPVYGPREQRPSKLDVFKTYIEDRLKAGVWNARVLLRELRTRGYDGGYTILTDWLRPQRESARVVAVRRFETPIGHQAQVDWGHLGTIEVDGNSKNMWGFTFTLGYSRAMMAEAALDQTLGTLLRMHEEAFRQLGGVPAEILYDRMKTVWLRTDERGEIVWNPVFLDFSRYWGFRPRLCRPYRAQTKGKIESGVKYVRRNFLCGLQGREPGGLTDLNGHLRRWIWEVANQRVHGTTHERVDHRWESEKLHLQAVGGRVPYPYVDEELRKVARDAYVSWESNRYSVPWRYAGSEVWVRDRENQIEVHYGGERIAVHPRASGKHQILTVPEHHHEIPLGVRGPSSKILVHIPQAAPTVEVRSLAAYESVAGGIQ